MMEKILSDYRASRAAMKAAIPKEFAPGARVKLAGVLSSAWDATVVARDAASERSMSADMLLLKFDNGNLFPVAVDEIETISASRKPRANVR